VFCITAARVLHVSLTSEKTEKVNGLQSIEIDRRWIIPASPYRSVSHTVQHETALLRTREDAGQQEEGGRRTIKAEAGGWRLEAGGGRLEAGGWRRKAGGGRLETGGWRLDAGGWRLEDGGWRMEAGCWRLKAGGWRLTVGGCRLEAGG
jgi:hypothetical protein